MEKQRVGSKHHTQAVVFLNMGGPNNLDEVEVFLKNMFNDKNIITVKSDRLRSFIADMIARFRGEEARENYKLIGGKSPLNDYTQRFIEAASSRYPDIYFTYAMRYTPPFAEKAIEDLQARDIQDVFLLPLYPHYSTTTTKSSLEDFMVKQGAYQPQLRILERFYANQAYNEAVIDSIAETLGEDQAEEFDLIFSAHSLPQKIVDAGDSYQNEVIENVGILRFLLEQRGINFASIALAYQSKLGPVKWLEPALGDKLCEYKHKRVIIYPLSFIFDNSETEVELDIEYRKEAWDRCIKEYRVCRCIGERKEFLEVVGELIERHLLV
jgi:ferrochelatase